MKSSLTYIAALLAIVALGASFNIDNSFVNALHWVLAGLGALCVGGVLFGWACERWEDVSQSLDYRTANGFGIESQTRKLQADASRGIAPPHQRPPFKPAAPRHTAAVTSLDKAYRATLDQARLSGEAAGIVQARGGQVAVNPHKKGSRAYLVWMASCEAMLESKAAADAHNAHSQRSAA